MTQSDPIHGAPPAGASTQRTTRGLLFGLAASAIGAMYMVFARWGIQHGLGAPDLTALRYGVAGLLMLPLLVSRCHKSPEQLTSSWRAWILVAIFAGAPFGMLMFGALKFAPTSHATVFPFAAMSVMGMALGAFVLKERLTARKLSGIALVLLGLLVVSGMRAGAFDSRAVLGDAMFVVAGSLWAAFGIVLRKYRLDPMLATAVVAFTALVLYVPAYVHFTDVHRLLAVGGHVLWTEVLVQGVVAGAGTVLTYARAVALLGAGRASVFPALAPGLAVLMAGPVLDHRPSSQELFGVAVVVAGLLWAVTGAAASPGGARLQGAKA
jgi:drug/metabolite transporter (DMT)-like permease